MNRLITVILSFVLLCTVGCTMLTQDPPSAVQTEATDMQTDETASAEDEPVILQTPAAEPEETQSEATEIPQSADPTASPDLSFRPITFDVYREVGWNVSEATMFRCDIDLDGETEDISFRLDEENDRTVIGIGKEKIELDGIQFGRALLIDLDPTTPYINLLVSIDEASDDYITTELHLADGKIVTGAVVYDLCYWDESTQKLMFYERSDMLGTKDGVRSYSGENLMPDSDWIELCDIPTQDEIENRRDELIEMGVLLHTIREVPCEINGLPAKIAKDAYVYMLGFNADRNVAEICTEDGIAARIRMPMCETDDYWGNLIEGLPVTDYFDNLFFAD